MENNQSEFQTVGDIDLNNLTPRLHKDCWVVADARKWVGCVRKNSLIQNGAIFSQADAEKMTDELNKLVYRNTFGDLMDDSIKIEGPFYAYRIKTAKDIGLL